MKLVFFGSSEFSTQVLDELLLHNIKPDVIITTADKPKGRKLIVTPNIVKVWAIKNNIKYLTPLSLRNNQELEQEFKLHKPDLFLVASYGKIIPPSIFNIPEKKTLNIHPSLLPKYRGASPIQAQILNDEREIGVTIMQIEETMDTGPILLSKKINMENWPIGAKDLEKKLAIEGARLFTHVLPEWLAGVLQATIQNENIATYCKKIEKEDGLLDLSDNPYKNLLKIKALEGWPGTYFFSDRKRIVVKEARLIDGELELIKIVPEGRREMTYADFLRGS